MTNPRAFWDEDEVSAPRDRPENASKKTLILHEYERISGGNSLKIVLITNSLDIFSPCDINVYRILLHSLPYDFPWAPMSSGRSPPQDAGHNPPGNSEPFYTNEDVAILHEIVVLAQELLPGLPEREKLPTNALFSAYFDILPRVGVDADHDNRYATVLFKIGGLRGEGTLYEKFEKVLSRMGIDIEFDHEEDELGSAQLQNNQADLATETLDGDHRSRDRLRRNSESSAWDLSKRSLPQRAERRNSFSSHAKLSPSQANLRQQLPIENRPSSLPARGFAVDSNNQRGDQQNANIRTWLESAPEEVRQGRGRSVSSRAYLQIHRRSSSLMRSLPPGNPSIASDEFQAPSDITAVTSAQEPQNPDPVRLSQAYPISHQPGSLMQIKASLILQHHLGFLAKQQLRLWRDRALQLQEDNANRDIIALHHDKRVLLSLALETWHHCLLQKRQIAETERFFDHLERRSMRVRDLYLIQKAFTHWSNCAFEEVERTSAARRHIVRTRTFNAWRDITVINELKVRRQIIKKFFAAWKRRYAVTFSNDAIAVQKFEGNLARKIFMQWIWRFWDMKASAWLVEGAKQRALSRWLLAVHDIGKKCDIADEERRSQLSWSTWRRWRSKTNDQIRQEQRARAFYELHVFSSSFRKWRQEAQIMPAKNTFRTDVELRLLRETLQNWLHQSRKERQAAAIDRLRILREAWTNWRHKGRLLVIRTRINKRVVLKAVYKWLLAQRTLYAKDAVNRKCQRNFLQTWTEKWNNSREQRWNQEDLAQDFAVRQMQASMLYRWHSRISSQQQREADALGLYSPKLLQGLLSQWSERTQHLRRLEKWSRDAEFYFLASKSLKRWESSTESAKREKRKDAYAQVRRLLKMNLARRVLLGWRQQAQQVLRIASQALEISRNKNVIIGMNFFDNWRARTEELGEMEITWREKVLKKQLVAWKNRSLAFQDLEVEAILSYQERQQRRSVKKWSLLTLQLKPRLHYANEIREKILKRTFRKTFTYWHQRAMQRRPIEFASVADPGASTAFGATARSEAWSEFGDEDEIAEFVRGLDDVNVSTPVPGYLSTPSKRAERITAAAARFSSTTPKVPLSTPFERHLRAQYLGGVILSTRKGPGRSRLGMGGAFPDIKDREGIDERERT